MSLLNKIIATGSVFAMTLALAPVANAVTVNPTNSASGNYIYCSNVAPFIATNDLNAVLVSSSNMVQFNYTQNVVANVENGVCKGVAVKTGTVPNIADHTTTFDIDSAGNVTNIKVSNTNPTQYITSCDGNKTVLTVTDTEKDALSLTGNVSGNNDFNTSSTTETGKIKITFTRKDNSFTGTNNVSLYVTETPTTLSATAYGNSAAVTYTSPAVPTPLVATAVAIAASYDVVPGFTNFKIDVSGVCSTSSSSKSSSSMSSSSMSSMSSTATTTSSSAVPTSSSKAMTTAGTSTDSDAKGMTPRTGGF